MEIKINRYGIAGLFSTNEYKPGDVISAITGTVLSHPTRLSFQTGTGEHIETNSILQYQNHSCNPNTKISGRKIISTAFIKPGDELTFNYNESEDQLSHPFSCCCCGRMIRGRLYVIQEQLTEINNL